MTSQIKLGDITIDVVRKDIKNIHLSVYPPNGSVRISAPSRMGLDTIRVFASAKLPWIKRQQTKLREQEREAEREYLDRESHYVWGKRYLLRIVEKDEPPTVELKPSRLLLQVRPGSSALKRQEVLEAWYRQLLKEATEPIIAKWEPRIGVRVEGYFVQRMKTKWGSCNHVAGTIRLNTELAKKPKECLEYIIVHEMVHLLEPTHNAHFVELMDQFMPQWELQRKGLNRLPVRHEDWVY
jgi:predicted metal-dependent hydrolase